jgi:hypothetical protein
MASQTIALFHSNFVEGYREFARIGLSAFCSW